MKKILKFIFGHQSKTIKYLKALRNSYIMCKKILPLLINKKLLFILRIIKGQIFKEFEPNLHKDKTYFSNKYQFNYGDWFSININVWKKFLTTVKEIRYLEIGSFEGRSAVFVGELNNTKEVTCVDTFEGSEEHKDVNFDLVFKNCTVNLNKLNIPYNLVKASSHSFFKNNFKKFNVIYIDGSHFYEDVKKDFINSFMCLEDNGILICDDFYWFFYKKTEQNPIMAILECYEYCKRDLEILFVNHQIIFKKVNSNLQIKSNEVITKIGKK